MSYTLLVGYIFNIVEALCSLGRNGYVDGDVQVLHFISNGVLNSLRQRSGEQGSRDRETESLTVSESAGPRAREGVRVVVFLQRKTKCNVVSTTSFCLICSFKR